MRAVIVEIRDKYVAALSKDGSVYKIKNDNYTVGQEIEMKKHLINNNRFIKIAATVAALIALIVVPAGAYLTPYSYVSLDVNPSVEYTLNIFERVLTVKAVNDDGERILKEIDLDNLKNKDIEVAVQEVLNGIIEAGFFENGQEGGVIIATSSKNDEKSQELAVKLKSHVEKIVSEESIGSDVEVEAIDVGEERVQEAKKLGVTPGKLNLVEKLQESSENPDDIILEDWLKKPVKEIMKATNNNRETEKAEDKKSYSKSDEVLKSDEETSEFKKFENEEKQNNKNDRVLEHEDNYNEYLESQDENKVDDKDNHNEHLESQDENKADDVIDENSKSEEEKKLKNEQNEKQNLKEKENNDNKKTRSN